MHSSTFSQHFLIENMAFTLQAIKECLFGTDDQIAPATNEKVLAADILETVFSADDGGKVLKKKLQDIVGEYGWTENLAKRILGGIENGIKQGAQMGQAMKDASGRAIEEARDFASEHPYFCALIAVGVLAVLMPWVLEALGFAELGPLEG